MHGIAGEEYPSVAVVLRHQREPGPPFLDGDDFRIHVRTDGALEQGFCVDFRQRRIGRNVGENDEIALAVERDAVHPPVIVDGEVVP